MKYTNLKRQAQVITELRSPVTPLTPLNRRKYMMTHSDTTGDLFVTIGTVYAEDKVGELRDEVRLAWTPLEDTYILYGEVLIDGPGISGASQVRYDIFRREMPLALRAIRYADCQFFEADLQRDQVPIFIRFKSNLPQYNQVFNLGTMQQYTNFDRKKSHKR